MDFWWEILAQGNRITLKTQHSVVFFLKEKWNWKVNVQIEPASLLMQMEKYCPPNLPVKIFEIPGYVHDSFATVDDSFANLNKKLSDYTGSLEVCAIEINRIDFQIFMFVLMIQDGYSICLMWSAKFTYPQVALLAIKMDCSIEQIHSSTPEAILDEKKRDKLVSSMCPSVLSA